ncbi:hypothetical protein MAR_019958 [Mya arenaria]|uniref:PiggyBac transposable element-derived protein domain-containing protein n=1 Tax=Mya arenaria TaxID=6604 RepID=A0ABY7E5Y7_MYAAR|nr:hypothetical protein MAR_019958 [Mya arenaria]
MDKRLIYHLVTLSQPARRRVLGNHLELFIVWAEWIYTISSEQNTTLDVVENMSLRYIFWFILNCCIVNTGLLYQEAATRRTYEPKFHVNVRLPGGKTTCKYQSRSLKTCNIPRVVYGCAVCMVHLCKECHILYQEAVRAQRSAPAWP